MSTPDPAQEQRRVRLRRFAIWACVALGVALVIVLVLLMVMNPTCPAR